MKTTDNDTEVGCSGFGSHEPSIAYVARYHHDRHYVEVESEGYVPNERDDLKIVPVTVETVRQMRAYELGMKILAHMEKKA